VGFEVEDGMEQPESCDCGRGRVPGAVAASLPGSCAAAAQNAREQERLEYTLTRRVSRGFLGLGLVKTILPNAVIMISRVLNLSRDNTPQTVSKLFNQTRPKAKQYSLARAREQFPGCVHNGCHDANGPGWPTGSLIRPKISRSMGDMC
jgi:hypothetical protein